MNRFLLTHLLAAALCVTHGASLAQERATVAPTATASDQNYQSRVSYQTYFADYLTIRKGKPADIIFIGDSITEQWRWGAGAPVWKKHFEERAFDFGLGGDKTQHVLWRLQNFDLSFIAPKVAVIMIGTNNLSDTPADIAVGAKAVVAETQKKFPGIKVIVMSILPNARANNKMATTNQLLKLMADEKSVHYLDLAARFTPEGDNWKGLSRDKLHLTVEGYEQWAQALQAVIK